MVSQARAREEQEALIASNTTGTLESSHGRGDHGSIFSHVDDDDGTTRAEELPTHQSSAAKRSTLGNVLFKLFLAAFITVIYMTNGLSVLFSSAIPNVQFDFTRGTTMADFYNPNTLKFRTDCAHDIREKGGFQMRADGEKGSCWNTFMTDDKWGESKNEFVLRAVKKFDTKEFPSFGQGIVDGIANFNAHVKTLGSKSPNTNQLTEIDSIKSLKNVLTNHNEQRKDFMAYLPKEWRQNDQQNANLNQLLADIATVRVADLERKWYGWFHKAPAMSNLNFFARVNGDISAKLVVGGQETSVRSTLKTDSKLDPANRIKDLDLDQEKYADGAEFQLTVTFNNPDTIQAKTNRIEVLYYPTGEDFKSAVLLPFSQIVQDDQLTKLAGDKSWINRDPLKEKQNVKFAADINVMVPKGYKYVPQGIIMFVWMTFAIVSLLICFVMDLFGGRGFKLVKMCFEWKNILLIAPAGIGWGLADVFEVMALGGLDPVLYSVVSQLRLLLTAILATFMINKVFTKLQWVILTVLTLMIISFSMKGGSGGEVNMVSWLFCGLKQLFSVACGVYGEKYLKGVDRPFVVQFFWIGLSATPFVCLGIFFSLVKPETNIFTYGINGGYDFGWDPRTFVVFIYYLCHFLATALCCKYLSAVNKNICNGCALLLLYFVEGMLFGKTLEAGRIFLTLAIASAVVMYALSGAYQKVKPASSSPAALPTKK